MFITIEGIDGSGKSTQARKLATWLTKHTHKTTASTYEPCFFREFILGSKGISPMSELLLFLADRAEHVNRIIRPAIEIGDNVVCERYNDSTLAYQCGGHGLNVNHVTGIIDSCRFPEPDVKILLDVNPELAYSRVLERRKQNSKIKDKFESEGLSLMKRVSEFYLTLKDYIVIHCTYMDKSEVFMNITSELEKRL
jgi:dTMP kinase